MSPSDQLNVEFEKCKEEQRVVTRIGGLLVSLLSGLRGDQLKRASAIFCKDQSYSLFALRKNLRKEKLTQIIQVSVMLILFMMAGLSISLYIHDVLYDMQ